MTPRITRQSIGGAIALLLTVALARGAPQTGAMLAESGAALSNSEPQQAEQMATAALAESAVTGPERAHLLLNRGLTHEQQGAHSDALLDLTQAIDMHALTQSDEVLALIARGTVLDALGRPQDALGDYDAAVRLSPDSAPALNNRANVLRRLGRLEEAGRDYRASLAAGNSQSEYPYYGLGQIAEAGGDNDAARGFYAKAVAANPHYRLATDRLSALRGPRESAVADNRVVLLRPPITTGGETAPAQAKPEPAVPPDAVPRAAGRALLALIGRAPEHSARVATANEGGGSVTLRPAIITDKVEMHGAGMQAQLGSWRQQSEAAQAWDRAVKRAGSALSMLTPHIVPVDLPGRGRYYRLQVSSDQGAAKLCASLSAKGLDCLAVRD